MISDEPNVRQEFSDIPLRPLRKDPEQYDRLESILGVPFNLLVFQLLKKQISFTS